MIIKKRRGFTLVEVIIVLAIIAIIAAIAIPNLTKVRQDSKLKADTQTCETIKRTVDTLIVDETIRYSTNDANTNWIKITPGGKNGNSNTEQYNITYGVGIKKSDGSSAADHNYLKDYFSQLKKPQQDNGDSYLVNIDTKGTVISVKPQIHNGTSVVDGNKK